MAITTMPPRSHAHNCWSLEGFCLLRIPLLGHKLPVSLTPTHSAASLAKKKNAMIM
eukprot:CAMPEP_0172898150 /NCGR_PEP_ID=MMETSP1075-20121228/159077_1 /TAXON_ID=2916 /ORGANISM="Ceratium fusus, Strain PA161109" /LENGTH=55 /DNA_ID=CAMNT_0013753875 /DNA_START=201 /DNA_END=365 /DNA_ORIENTATION=+